MDLFPSPPNFLKAQAIFVTSPSLFPCSLHLLKSGHYPTDVWEQACLLRTPHWHLKCGLHVLLSFSPAGICLSTAREISPKCKLDCDSSPVNILSGVPGAPDHMVLEVPGPFLQASPAEACWFLSRRHSLPRWFFCNPSGLCPSHWFCAWLTILLLCWWG